MVQMRHPAQTVTTMKLCSSVQCTTQGATKTLGHCRPHRWRQQGQNATGVGGGHRYGDIASYSGNQLDAQFRGTESEHQCQCIIDAWVSIDNHWTRSCSCRHAQCSPVPVLGRIAVCSLIGGIKDLDGMHDWDV